MVLQEILAVASVYLLTVPLMRHTEILDESNEPTGEPREDGRGVDGRVRPDAMVPKNEVTDNNRN